MSAIKTLPVLLALLYGILNVNGNHTCEGSCPIAISGKHICSSDGKIYPDECRAKCITASNRKVFECDPQGTVNSCDLQCQQWNTNTHQTPSVAPHTHAPTVPPVSTTSEPSTYYYPPSTTTAPTTPSVAPSGTVSTFPSNVQSVEACQSQCPPSPNSLNRLRNSICGGNGYVYDSQCHGRCKDQSMIFRFSCSRYFNFSDCQRVCSEQGQPQLRYTNPFTNQPSPAPAPVQPNTTSSFLSVYNQPSSTTSTFPNFTSSYQTPTTTYPTPAPTTPAIECNDGPLVCASDGKVYLGTCHEILKTTETVRFNCSRNGINSLRRCRRLCWKFSNDPCITQCSRPGWKSRCYENGKVMKNRCLAKCMSLKTLFKCGFRRRGCRKRCKDEVFSASS